MTQERVAEKPLVPARNQTGPDWSIAQRWHGVYAKHSTDSFVTLAPADCVRIVTGLGGAGMTLSLALGERTIRELGI